MQRHMNTGMYADGAFNYEVCSMRFSSHGTVLHKCGQQKAFNCNKYGDMQKTYMNFILTSACIDKTLYKRRWTHCLKR